MRVLAGGTLYHRDRLETTVGILWETELCHTRMEELTRPDFRHHHIASTSLNVHLFEHRVPLTLHKNMSKMVDSLDKVLEKATGRIDSLVGKVEAIKKQKRGSGRGGILEVNNKLTNLLPLDPIDCHPHIKVFSRSSRGTVEL